jgi:AraC-like DNA-binding protein
MYKIPNSMAGIDSKQPWFILNAASQFSMLISEDSLISHFYHFETDQSNKMTLAIPDGCVDIVFDCDLTNPSAKVCGTTLRPCNANLTHNHRYFGIRFAIGVKPHFLNISADELVGQEINLLELAPDALNVFEQVVTQPLYSKQATLFSEYFRTKPTQQTSALITGAMKLICESHGNVRGSELERRTGYTRRTLLRKFVDEIGISPKVISRIVRCQRAIHQINYQEDLIFSNLAYDLGFTDQSHFQREFKKLVSTTPLEFQSLVNRGSYKNRIQDF